jgi:NitT/TauT family transport system substrate-binding protein
VIGEEQRRGREAAAHDRISEEGTVSMKRSRITFLVAAASAVLILGACQAPGGTPATRAAVRLQLQWVPQAQFAGYFAAVNEGYYAAENLDVTLVPGGPDVIPQQAGSAANGPEFTISWVPKVLEAREGASDLVDIAQVFQRSGTLSVSWKDSNITSPQDFAGKKVGVWDFGNEFEVTAAGKKAGLEAGVDYTKVIQPFDMTLLLSRQIDVAEAMIYNEYAQVLEAANPATGQLYQPGDLNVINYNEQQTAMLQDAIFARAAWLSQAGNADIAVRFLRASFKGWIFCRDNPAKCVDYVLAAGSALGKGHQTWQMNEINGLIWPSPNGIGQLDKALWDQTVAIAKDAGVIKNDPSTDAFRTDLATQALSGLSGDTKGTSFQKGTVAVTPGGN